MGVIGSVILAEKRTTTTIKKNGFNRLKSTNTESCRKLTGANAKIHAIKEAGLVLLGGLLHLLDREFGHGHEFYDW